jgi:hypothetical protein
MKRLLIGVLALLLSAPVARAERPTYPLCFVPGMSGGSTFLYETLPSSLLAKGIDFLPFHITFKARIEIRARILTHQLSEQLKINPDFKCHLMAHSLGGLVARYALTHLHLVHPTRGKIPLTEVILSVTTVSTPHRGTPLGGMLDRFLPAFAADAGAVQMSEQNVAPFNEPGHLLYSPMVPGLPYYSYRSYLEECSLCPGKMARMGFRTLSRILGLQHKDPRNDFIVPIESQGYGRVLGDIRVPHSYFDRDLGVKPGVAEFYEGHWRFVNGLDEVPFFEREAKHWAPLFR